MTFFRSYKTELDLNNKQRNACFDYATATRQVYNWALQRKLAAYEAAAQVPTATELQREFARLKKAELSEFEGLSHASVHQALHDVDSTFANFLRRNLLKEKGLYKGEVALPSFKSVASSFRLTGPIQILDSSIQLPYLGRLRLKETGYLASTNARILSAIISEKAGHWFVSLNVEEQTPSQSAHPALAAPATPAPILAQNGSNSIPLETLAVNTLQTEEAPAEPGRPNTPYDNSETLRKNIKRVERAQKRLSRRIQGSCNWEKERLKLARLQYRVSNIEKDNLEKNF